MAFRTQTPYGSDDGESEGDLSFVRFSVVSRLMHFLLAIFSLEALTSRSIRNNTQRQRCDQEDRRGCVWGRDEMTRVRDIPAESNSNVLARGLCVRRSYTIDDKSKIVYLTTSKVKNKCKFSHWPFVSGLINPGTPSFDLLTPNFGGSWNLHSAPGTDP